MKRNWTKLYSTYRKHYTRAVDKLQTKSIRVRPAEMYSRREFIDAYSQLEMIRKDEAFEGIRKVPNVMQDLVVMQKYRTNDKRAKILKDAIKEYNKTAEKKFETFTTTEIKVLGINDVQFANFWDTVSELTKVNGSLWVRTNIFGSE